MNSNSQTLASQESNLMLRSSMVKGRQTGRSSTSSAMLNRTSIQMLNAIRNNLMMKVMGKKIRVAVVAEN